MTGIPLNSTQQLILVIGASLAVAVYLARKIIRWRTQQRQTPPVPPKMRTPREPIRSSVPAVDRAASVPTTAGAGTIQPAPDSTTSSRSPKLETLWIQEPNGAAGGSDPTGANDDDYPYADPSDYRFGGLTPVLAALVPGSSEGRQSLTKALRNAGYFSPHAWHNFAAIRYLGIILPLLLFGTLLVLVPEPLEGLMIAGVVVGPILGWALPALSIRGQATRRLKDIESAMPDMLDLLNMCVSQGMTVPAALGRVGRDIAPVYPALSKELQIVTDQAHVGTLSQALTSFSSRVDVPEVHSFSSLLIQTEQMGTSLSDALVDYSDGMRETLRQRADEKANSATFKLLFPTVLCLMPAVFLFLMGPALIDLNRFFYAGGLDALRDRAAMERLENQQR